MPLLALSPNLHPPPFSYLVKNGNSDPWRGDSVTFQHFSNVHWPKLPDLPSVSYFPSSLFLYCCFLPLFIRRVFCIAISSYCPSWWVSIVFLLSINSGPSLAIFPCGLSQQVFFTINLFSRNSQTTVLRSLLHLKPQSSHPSKYHNPTSWAQT